MTHKPGDKATPKTAHEAARAAAIPCATCGVPQVIIVECDEIDDTPNGPPLQIMVAQLISDMLKKSQVRLASVEDAAEQIGAMPEFWPAREP